MYLTKYKISCSEDYKTVLKSTKNKEVLNKWEKNLGSMDWKI